MVITLEIPDDSKAAIEALARSAADAPAAMAAGLLAAGWVGAEGVRLALVTGGLGIRAETQRPGSGLAASVQAWSIDAAMPLIAVGVPSNAPAAAYARILEEGGDIRPVHARALAVPIHPEARQYTSPRDQAGLTMIKRKGKPPLLVRMLSARGHAIGFIPMWVLVAHVYIAPRRWLSRGLADQLGAMGEAYADELMQRL